MTLLELKKSGEKLLLQAGIGEAGYDAEELLLYVFSLTRGQYLLRLGESADTKKARRFLALAGERAAHVPLQHLTGTAWFYGFRFSVNKEVLIPRYDTEVLVEKALSGSSGKGYSVLDLCTGSGIIACVLALEGSYSSVTASDISSGALETAARNAERLNAPVRFIRSDLFSDIEESFDVIVSNPPYIRDDVIPTLSPEVRDHDPRLALSGGEDGLSFYRRIAPEGKKHLTRGGQLYLEIGDEQADSVSDILRAEGFGQISVFRDLSGRDRVIRAVFR